MGHVRIAIVQEGPAFLNFAKSLEKMAILITEAAHKGANLVVFGETWLTGYPAWLDYCPEVAYWNHQPTKQVFARMYKQGVEVPGATTEVLGKLAQKHQIVICIGVNEVIRKGRGNGTMFNTMLIIGSNGELLNHHRKLMPTYTEKMLYGLGDGKGLKVVDSQVGRIGGLICWEHWMPLARQALHEQGEHIHIALWPKVHEMHQVASRSYAFEGRCFVVAVGQLMQVKDIPQELKRPEYLEGKEDAYLLDGGSCVIGPDGNYLLPPQFGVGGILMVDIPDTDRVYEERMTLDTSGHYNRLDVFSFDWKDDRIIK